MIKKHIPAGIPAGMFFVLPGGVKKPSPGGEGGMAQAGPDEVEGSIFVPTYGDNRSLRPHQSQRKLHQRSSGMTATGSHKDFGFAARSTTLQGEPFLRASKSLLLK